MYFTKGDIEIEYVDVFFHLLNDELENFNLIPGLYQKAISTILRTYLIAETCGINVEDYVRLVGQSVLASYVNKTDPGLFLRMLFTRIGKENFTEKFAKYINDYKKLFSRENKIAFCQNIIGERYANTLFIMVEICGGN